MRVLVFNRWLWKKWTLSAMDAYFLLCCWFYGDLGLSFCLLAIWPFLVLLAWNLWWSRLGGFWAVLLVACGDLWKRRDFGQGHYFAKGYYFDACLQVLIFFVSVISVIFSYFFTRAFRQCRSTWAALQYHLPFCELVGLSAVISPAAIKSWSRLFPPTIFAAVSLQNVCVDITSKMFSSNISEGLTEVTKLLPISLTS